jgi:hypothetical protein
MKALTVYQPWASLIVVGAKPFEFRHWNVAHRYPKLIGQRIVIHASARTLRTNEVHDILEAEHAGGCAWAATCLHREPALPVLEKALEMTLTGRTPPNMLPSADDLPYSAGLGTAILGEPRDGLEIAKEFGVDFANDSDRDEEANWGWPMLEIEKWDEPIPMKGHQGFWNWPGPEAFGL